MYDTIEKATEALQTAVQDTAADFGEEAVEQGYFDIVRSIAACCTTEVKNELLQREGLVSV